MDLDRLKEILDWMARSPVAELEISDGDFEVHLKKSAGAASASPVAPAASVAAGQDVTAAGFGVIHLSPAPGAPPFVTKGQAIAVGQTLCTIEAMKVFSPIEAECAGTLVAILVADGADVSSGQSLFRIE